jgi:uncharacterized protein
MVKQSHIARNEELFGRASRYEDQGKVRSAIRLYLIAAKNGDAGSQLNLGNLYDAGVGVRRNRDAAIYWYKRACRRGSASAANNLGVLWRNDKEPKQALMWFQKAVQMGDEEAHLEIADHYLRNDADIPKAIFHLEKVSDSRFVSEAGAENADRLLKRLKRLPAL